MIEEFVALLRRHTEIEEKVFYSALTEFDQARALVEESLRGHRRIDRALAEFDTLRYASSGGDLHALFNDLKRSFAEHVERDEARLLPEAERLLGGARLERMLREMEQAKDRFEPNHNGGARVHIQLCYHPPGGAIGHALAKLFGSDPKSEMDADLLRMKTFIESGRPPHDAANPSPRGREAISARARALRTPASQQAHLAGGP
jgi:hemerythrin-like domain-containing protein